MENDTCRDRYELTNLEPITKFSNDQIAYYCPLYAQFYHYQAGLYFLQGASMAVTGLIGLVCNFLTLATFCYGSAFKGPSFLYHKAMAILELLHMAIMCQSGILTALQFPGNTYWMIWWRDCTWGGWMVGDAARTAINCLIMFVSLERMIAVCIPVKFYLINTDRFAAGAIMISILLGCLSLPSLAAYRVVFGGGDYGSVATEFGNTWVYATIMQAVNVIKLTLGTATLVLSVLVASGMYRAYKRAARMRQGGGQNRGPKVMMACKLQLIAGTFTVLAHLTFVWYRIVDQQRPYPAVGRLALLWVESFDEVLESLNRARYVRAVQLINALAAEVDHGGRFVCYFLLHTTFRASFKEMCSKFRHATVNPVN